MHTIRGVVADMDGVIWRGDEVLPGAAAFFQYINGRLPYVFATNNSSRTAAYYIDKLNKLGIPAAPGQIISSAIATAGYLAKRYPPHSQMYVVGGVGIKEALRQHGFVLTNAPRNTPTAVVVGIDREITYEKLKMAIMHVHRGAALFGTNADKTIPVPDGLAPGAGSILAAIEAGAGVSATVIGKPASPMFEIALERLQTQPEETLMIGDRLETDIEGAQRLRMKTALVLSGVTTDAAIMDAKPDFIFQDLAELVSWWRNNDEKT